MGAVYWGLCGAQQISTQLLPVSSVEFGTVAVGSFILLLKITGDFFSPCSLVFLFVVGRFPLG